MKKVSKNKLFVGVTLFFAAMHGFALAAETELVYKICFPAGEAADRNAEDCKDEDCGLMDVVDDRPTGEVKKNQTYTFLGVTDYGAMWGANNQRIIGDGRVRFLMYVKPVPTRQTAHQEKKFSVVPTAVIHTAFFSSFGQYKGSSISVQYNVKKNEQEAEEVRSGPGALEMLDLHCSARKVKIYNNQTLYYRRSDDQSQDSQCLELLWEKPRVPLPWQPLSPLTMDILADFYCKHAGNE